MVRIKVKKCFGFIARVPILFHTERVLESDFCESDRGNNMILIKSFAHQTINVIQQLHLLLTRPISIHSRPMQIQQTKLVINRKVLKKGNQTHLKMKSNMCVNCLQHQ